MMDLLKILFRGDKVIWIIFLFLCLTSFIEVFSATSTLTYGSASHWGPITQHGFFLLVGAVIVVLVHNMPCHRFRVFPLFLLPASAVLLFMLLVFDSLNIGGVLVIEKINEAGRWIKLCGVQFQPSEFAKMGVVIVTARALSVYQTDKGADPKAYKIIIWILAIFCGLIVPENYSTAMLLFVTIYLMMIIGLIEAKKILKTTLVMIVAGVVFVTFLLATPNEVLKQIPMGHRFATWKERIVDFTHHEEIPAAKYDINENAQVAHARIAVATSNLLGKGPGNSVQRDFLSQAFSDFIFAIVVEELGLVGGFAVVMLYIWLLIRVGRIAKKCERSFPAFLIIGIALLLVIQAFFNMCVAVGLAPVTGQPLPLISRGGTSTIINCIYIGMILSVSRYVEEQEIKTVESDAVEEATVSMDSSESDIV